MNAKKSLPPPAATTVQAALRRRYRQDDQEDSVTEAPAEEAPTQEASVTPRAQEATASRAHDVETARAQEPMKPRRRDVTTSRRKAPAADEAVALTVRFDQAEYDELDEWILALRRELGRRKLDKSELIRTLLGVARSNARVRAALVKALGKP